MTIDMSLGIGRGTALALARQGCRTLFLADINREGLEETSRQIRKAEQACRIEIFQVNISDEKSVELMVRICVEAFGRLDYALNIAGVVPDRVPIESVDVATYDRIVGINDYGVSFMCEHCTNTDIKDLAMP